MGWHNPPISWAEYHRRLVGRPSPDDPRSPADGPASTGGPASTDHPASAGGRLSGDGRPGQAAGSSAGGGGQDAPAPASGDRTRRGRRLRALPGPGTGRSGAGGPGLPGPERSGAGQPGGAGAPAAAPPGAFRRAGRARPVPYAELHCHTNYSFLDGASPPEQLAGQAARLGLAGLAVTDHDGFYGVVEFAESARDHGLATVFGAELTLSAAPVESGPNQDPAGEHLLVLARGAEGYRRLSTAISEAHLRGGRKGRPVYDPAQLSELGRGHWWVLTGCRKGAVPAALAAAGAGEAMTDGRDAAERRLRELVDLFGADRVAVELTDHGRPDDDDRNEILAELATRRRLPMVATGNVHYARPADGRLAAALAAVRARCSLDELAGWLPPAPSAFLRSGAEMAARFGAWPGAVESTVDIAADCAFDLRLVAPRLPDFDLPAGVDSEMAYLRELTYQGAKGRYGEPARHPAAYRQIEHELAIIDELGFPATSWWCGTSCGSAPPTASCARAGARRPTPRSATRWASPPPTRSPTTCCSNGSSRRSGTGRRTSTSTSPRTAARRSSSTCTPSTVAGTPRRWRT
ncbi:hypothetical protein Athai_24350 [Actinocatenispora thailandica]|uniref:Polymerase/histidinol phosphatase N-terminal domain-containing protein n=1 Tax=Actinocatenispora thailandica TaxID=227318 RepID=A0A7R7DNN2_9ACTN|nr:hypothetical protein Athai_24350 [Actinocatenispora thailandica]